MKWVAVIFLSLAACMIFGWWYIMTPSASEKYFTECMQSPKLSDRPDKDKKIICHFAVAGNIAIDGANAACASHESSKFQKCERLSTKLAKDGQTDIILVNVLQYRDDWNNVHFADYTMRLTRASVDDFDWHVANTEFRRSVDVSDD